MVPPHSIDDALDRSRLRGAVLKDWIRRVFNIAMQHYDLHDKTLEFNHKATATRWLVSGLIGRIRLDEFKNQTPHQALSTIVTCPGGVFELLVRGRYVRIDERSVSKASATKSGDRAQGVFTDPARNMIEEPVVKMEDPEDGGPLDLNTAAVKQAWVRMIVYKYQAMADTGICQRFDSRASAHRFLINAVGNELKIPIFKFHHHTLAVEILCRIALEELVAKGWITFAQLTRQATLCSNQTPLATVGMTSGERTGISRAEQKDTDGVERYTPASWNAGYQQGHRDGFAAGFQAAQDTAREVGREAGREAGRDAGGHAGREAGMAAAMQLLGNEQSALGLRRKTTHTGSTPAPFSAQLASSDEIDTRDPTETAKRQTWEHTKPRGGDNSKLSFTGAESVVNTPNAFLRQSQALKSTSNESGASNVLSQPRTETPALNRVAGGTTLGPNGNFSLPILKTSFGSPVPKASPFQNQPSSSDFSSDKTPTRLSGFSQSPFQHHKAPAGFDSTGGQLGQSTSMQAPAVSLQPRPKSLLPNNVAGSALLGRTGNASFPPVGAAFGDPVPQPSPFQKYTGYARFGSNDSPFCKPGSGQSQFKNVAPSIGSSPNKSQRAADAIEGATESGTKTATPPGFLSDEPGKPTADPMQKGSPAIDWTSRKRSRSESTAESEEFFETRIPPTLRKYR